MIGFLIRIVTAEAIGAAFDSRARRREMGYARQNPAVRPASPLTVRPPSSQFVFVMAGFTGLPLIGIGVIGIAFGALAAVRALTGDTDWSVALNLLTNCTVLGVLPGFVTLILGGWFGLRRRRMERLVALAETHARLPLSLLASELKITDDEARQLVLSGVERQHVRGRFDLEAGVFLSSVADAAPRQWAGMCPHCSAQVSVVLAPGQPGICSYCRGALPTGAT